MTRGFKVLTTVLVLIVGALAVATGYFYAKTTNLEGQLKTAATNAANVKVIETPDIDLSAPVVIPSVTPSPSISVKATVVPKATPTPKATTIASPTPKSTTATSGTYTVKAGDSMSSIAASLGVNWLTMAEANGLDATTANNIKVGQVLKVPAK